MSRRKRRNLVRNLLEVGAPRSGPDPKRPPVEPLIAEIDREWARLLQEAS
jgi:hypothetical protein